MSRINVEVPKEVHQTIKVIAAKRNVTVIKQVNDILLQWSNQQYSKRENDSDKMPQ